MHLTPTLRKASELGFALTAVATLILAGCGGGGGSASNNGGTTPAAATTTTAVTPFKGKFTSGNVTLVDAHGNPVTLSAGGSINANGVASVTFPASVTYPLTVNVAGTYLDETSSAVGATGTISAGYPLQGLIPAAASGVPVTAVTHMARSMLPSTGFSAASAVAAITGAASSVLGVTSYSQAMLPPVFDANGKTSDINTLKLAALANVIGQQGAGADLNAKLYDIATKLAAGSAVNAVIPPATWSAAVLAVNASGAGGMVPSGITPPTIPAFTPPASSLISQIGAAPSCPAGQVLNPLMQCVSDSTGAGAGAPTITILSALSGAVGDVITISGTNFGLGPNHLTTGPNYDVKFNGVAASPSGVGTTSMTVPVPAGATTGPITITTTTGSVTSSMNFTVTQVAALKFSPISGVVGSLVTIPNYDVTKPWIRFGNLCARTAYVSLAMNATGTAFNYTYSAQVPVGLPVGITNVTASNTDGTLATLLGTFDVTATASGAGTWIDACGTNANREQGHTATLINNGKVLVAGGEGAQGVKFDSAELYDPSTGLWTITGKMTAMRTGHSATLLKDGKVLVVSTPWLGLGVPSPTTTAEIYDPATGLWTATGSLNKVHGAHTATLLQDGRVLVAGGLSPVLPVGGTTYIATDAELYDPATGAWTITGSLNQNTYGGSTTLLPNGKVLLVGGTTISSLRQASLPVEIYDPATSQWTLSTPNALRPDAKATLLNDGTVLVTGGSQVLSGLGLNARLVAGPTAELYDPATGLWTVTGEPSMPLRMYHTTTRLNNGKVLLAAGSNNSNGSTATADLYDPVTKLWTSTGNLNFSRQLSTATALTNGNVLVVGGFNGAGNSPELYLP